MRELRPMPDPEAILSFLTAWLSRLWCSIRPNCLQSVLTAGFLTTMYALVHIKQEGSVVDGLRSSFIESEADRNERLRDSQLAGWQDELRSYSAASVQIDQLLARTLALAPGAAHIRLDLIHDGGTGLSGMEVLRYDGMNSVVAPGHSAGPALLNQPLSDWTDLLPELLAGRCAYRMTSDLTSPALRSRLEGARAASALVCPATSAKGRLVAALFIVWGVEDRVPQPNELAVLMEQSLVIGGRIAMALDVQSHADAPVDPDEFD